MKNTVKLFKIIALAAVIGLSITSYAAAGGRRDASGGGGTLVEPGTLTITGLDAYNGFFIMAESRWENEEEQVWEEDRKIVAARAFDGTTYIGADNFVWGGEIKDGRIALPVWEVKISYSDVVRWRESEDGELDPSPYTATRYSGNDTVDFWVVILDDDVPLGTRMTYHYIVASGALSVTFNNGSAAAVFTPED